MSPPQSNPIWPVWTDGPIVLFHGTTITSAKAIVSAGVKISEGRPNTDFGRGFYTTTGIDQASVFAKRKEERLNEPGSVVRLAVSRTSLALLATLCFVRGDRTASDFWSYVDFWRTSGRLVGVQTHAYDVVYGPVAERWFGPLDSRVYEGYDQISFHTEAAVAMLSNGSLCSMEIL